MTGHELFEVSQHFLTFRRFFNASIIDHGVGLNEICFDDEGKSLFYYLTGPEGKYFKLILYSLLYFLTIQILHVL